MSAHPDAVDGAAQRLATGGDTPRPAAAAADRALDDTGEAAVGKDGRVPTATIAEAPAFPLCPLGTGLDRLMPMHLRIDAEERIVHLGPTAASILRDCDPLGRRFWEVFAPTRPLASLSLRQLAHQQAAVHLRLRHHETTQLRGVIVPHAAIAGEPGDVPGGALINLSFGIDLAAAVRRHGLTAGDFAPTDLAMELLYLQEAKSAVLHELLALSQRLDEARRDAERQALSDPLTGLANRRACEAALQAAVEGLAEGAGFALAHIDLDRFKQVNDSQGHAAGDQVLTHVASVLTAGVRRQDLIARVGGDEFVLLLRGTDDPVALRDFGDRMIARIEQPFDVVPRPGAAPVSVGISASIGIVVAAAGAPSSADRLMSIADAALYAAKRRGRGRCLVRPSTEPRGPDAAAG